jgi:hypothetical protein
VVLVKEKIQRMVPTGTASKELAARYPHMFAEGDPIGYMRPAQKQRKRQGDDDMVDGEDVQEQEIQDEVVTEGKKPRGRKKKVDAAEKPAKVVKAPWEPDEALSALIESMKDYARRGDRRACARLVKESLETRNLCKATLDSGDGLPSSDAGEGDDDSPDSE